MHVSGRDSNKFCKFHEFWRTLRKCHNFILFLRSGAVGIFLSKIVTSPNCLKFHMHVSGGDSNKFCKFYEFWRTLRKCQNFILIWRLGTDVIFLSKIVASSKLPQIFTSMLLEIIAINSVTFMNFGELWENVNLIFFLKSSTVGIFLSKIVTSPYNLKFHKHVSGGDSNKFCKFYEFWRTLRKCQNFILIWRLGTDVIFLSKIVASPNCLKFSHAFFWR